MRLLKVVLLSPLAWRFAGMSVATAAAAMAWTVPYRSDLLSPASTIEPATPEPGRDAMTDHGGPYSEIDRYPLFYATRQPWVLAAPPPSPPPKILTLSETYALTGVVLGPDVRVALLNPIQGGKPIALTEGQLLDGWTLRNIRANGLHFEKDGAPIDLAFPALHLGPASGHAPN